MESRTYKMQESLGKTSSLLCSCQNGQLAKQGFERSFIMAWYRLKSGARPNIFFSLGMLPNTILNFTETNLLNLYNFCFKVSKKWKRGLTESKNHLEKHQPFRAVVTKGNLPNKDFSGLALWHGTGSNVLLGQIYFSHLADCQRQY